MLTVQTLIAGRGSSLGHRNNALRRRQIWRDTPKALLTPAFKNRFPYLGAYQNPRTLAGFGGRSIPVATGDFRIYRYPRVANVPGASVRAGVQPDAIVFMMMCGGHRGGWRHNLSVQVFGVHSFSR